MILRGKKTFPAPERILVTQLRRIGDALLCTPAVRALAKRFPDAALDFLTQPPCVEVFGGNPYVREVLVAPTDRTIRSFLRIARQLRHRRYDWVVDFFSNPRSAQYTYLTGARVRVGLDRLGRRWGYTHHAVEEAEDRDLYAVDLRLKILERLGVESAGRELEIYSDHHSEEARNRINALLEQVDCSRPLVAVATGTANPAKFYPPDLTAQVIAGLQAEGLSVIVTSGPGETALAKQAIGVLNRPIPHLEDARTTTLAALYRRVSAYTGPDSAPKHIAAACGIPTVAYFGAGRPANWHDAQNPRDLLLIAPCDLRPRCTRADCAKRQCLRKIPPADVCRSVVRLLKKQETQS
ncbi:glycosyltransferase family 9 protein [bacterium]|nr:glycosyltransferase family 9 protein [bacterium]MBU1984593.1 glycosyltransferase family 9 protein [bacterium]